MVKREMARVVTGGCGSAVIVGNVSPRPPLTLSVAKGDGGELRCDADLDRGDAAEDANNLVRCTSLSDNTLDMRQSSWLLRNAWHD